MARTGPPCPLCGRTGIFAGAAEGIYIPPSNHVRRVLTWSIDEWRGLRTLPGHSVYDVCPLLDGERTVR